MDEDEVRLPSSSKVDDSVDDDKEKDDHRCRMTLEDEMLASGGSLTIRPIGVVRSVYRLCVGTPRQGLLAPQARGRIDLNSIGQDAVLGLQEYSHIWIFFIFHLNTLPEQVQQPKSGGGENGKDTKKNVHRRLAPLKISPPALGGRKVGVLSTRSPHRPNPIGMTLARLDRIDTSSSKKKYNINGGSNCSKASPASAAATTATTTTTTTTSLYISGLDLVDGTPVIDIKPYVPHYDSPCHYPLSSSSLSLPPHSSADDTSIATTTPHSSCRLPPWVADGLATKRSVHFLPRALLDLQSIFDANPNALEFYGNHSGNCDASTQEGYDNIKACIQQVLAIDVRSRFQSNKARRGKFQAERALRVQQTYSSRTSVSTVTTAGDGDADHDDDTQTKNVDNTNNDAFFSGDDDNEETEMEETYCTQQLDRLLIHYKVTVPDEMNRPTSSVGSGAEDLVQVVSIELLSLQT
jgi:tRNA (adenine37-N6)-methyltransferase